MFSGKIDLKIYMKFIATKIIVVVTYRNNKFVAISFTGTLLTYRNKKISCNKFPRGSLLQQKLLLW